MLSVGLIPENELTEKIITDMNPLTRGPNVDDSFETEIEGVFACGNVLHVHDLVDFVTQESNLAGEAAAKYIQEGPQTKKESYQIETGDMVRYTISLSLKKDFDNLRTIRFRVSDVKQDVIVSMKCDVKEISKLKKKVVSPGEMESVILVPIFFEEITGNNITISIVEDVL